MRTVDAAVQKILFTKHLLLEPMHVIIVHERYLLGCTCRSNYTLMFGHRRTCLPIKKGKLRSLQ